MKLTHVIGDLGTGGAESMVVNLSIELQRLGLDVSITTLRNSSGIPLDVARDHGIPIQQLNMRKADPRILPSLRKDFHTSDLVHVHLFPALYWAALAKGDKHSSPWVYTEHSTANRRRDTPILRPVERFAYSRVDKLVAVSAGVGETLTSYLKSLRLNPDIEVINNGISPKFFENSRAKDYNPPKIRMISIGTMDARKNFGLAIEIAARIPNANLTIVGSGPEKAELASKIAELRVGDRVRLTPKTPHIRDLLDQNDLLLSTSRVEGFGLVAAEAMARGLPVIAPNIPGISGIIGNGSSGALFSPGPSAAAEASKVIQELTASPLIYSQASHAAIARARHFSIAETAASYIQQYELLSHR